MIKQSSIVENTPQFIMYLSPGGELSYVNPSASELTGHTKTEILTGGLELIFDTEIAQAIKNTYIPNTLRKGSSSFEANMTRKDGKIRVLAFTSFAAENGNIGAIAQDVTEMRVLEAELITAKEQAEQNSRAKSEFMSRMSHEMRTPMNTIIGMASIIKISYEPEQKADCLKEIDNAARQLLQLIDNVLDISSLEKRTLTIEHSEFNFSTMLSNVLKTVKLYTEEKHQTLLHRRDPLIPDALIGDEKRLTQIIWNLLMNANKFSPERGTIQLDASVVGEENGNLVLKIEVSDNGIGIPEEKQATIFNLFEQADGGLSRKFEGAGLGLPISKHLVGMMGGRIWVESEPGKGANFIFTIRIKNASGEKPARNYADESIKSFKGKTVLLVDDVKVNREALMTMLKDTQIQIDCAENGLQAVELFSNDPGRYDIILMDINMPGIDGWETSRRIRLLTAPGGARVKILAMLANTSQEDVEKSRKAGMDDHIGKPVDFNELFHKLNQHLV
jgi:PAS domain S-box-containing protein